MATLVGTASHGKCPKSLSIESVSLFPQTCWRRLQRSLQALRERALLPKFSCPLSAPDQLQSLSSQ